jgi:GTP-binding protein YchF
MKLGIIGLPGAGKTTIFNALTSSSAPTGQSVGGRFEVLSAVVDVPDPRVERLAEMYKPEKTTHARITFADVAGLQKGMGEGGGLSGPMLNQLAQMNGFVHVVRAWEDERHPHPDGSINAARDLMALDAELLLNDLVLVEGKRERLEEGLKKGATRDKATAQADLKLFEHLSEALHAEQPLRSLQFSPEEEKSLRDYSFLTLKPVLVVINLADNQEPPEIDYPYPASAVVWLRGQLESELAQLEGEDLLLFMEEFGIQETGLNRVIRACYDLMGLHSFFTVGEDEVRAWTLHRGETALDAAGTIHSDLAKGFIRAETVHYDDLMAAGSIGAARTAGKLRQEGKQYVVQDGDVINIKFNL